MKALRSLLVAAALFCFAAAPALAQQSSPGWSFGYVPSPAEWSFWFGKKVDWQGAAYCPVSGCTFTGPLLTAPATTLGAGLNIGQGVAPTSPNNGDIWMTVTGLFVRFNGSTVQVSLPGSPFTITSNSNQAFAVGPNGATNPVFNIDASVASAANGLNVQGTAVGGGVNVSAISAATNESLSINAKGSGNIFIGTVSTGTFFVNNPEVITATNANSLAVGQVGVTNPAFQVDDSTASSATGLKVKSAASGAGIALSAISSATNENLTLDAKGSGTITLGSVSTGAISLAQATAVTGNLSSTGSILSSSASGGIGYQTGLGAGGTVTQATSRTTGVTLNKITGAITMFTAAPTLGSSVQFTVTDSSVAATDTVIASVKSSTNTYTSNVTLVAAGSFQINVADVVGTASDAPVINFAVIKASAN